MAVVGTAYVAIRAVTDKLRGDIETSLAGSSDSARRAGESAGKNFSDGFKGTAGGDGPDFSHATSAAAAAGDEAGRNFSSGIQGHAPDVDIEPAMRRAVDSARTAGDDAGKGFSDGMKRGAADAESAGMDGGKRAGNGFARGFEGSGAKGGIANIGARMLALVPIIAILVGAISSLVSGLFAIASAAAPAAGGLAVLPGLAIAAASAFGVLKMAFGGIGKALGAGIKEQSGAAATAAKNAGRMASAGRAVEKAQRGVADAARQNAEALASANRQIEDSRRSLQNTLQDTAMRHERNNRSLFTAERSLQDALKSESQAQRDLNDARKEAKDDIIALQFALEDSGLSQERAAINLIKARRQLQLMSELPPDNLLRREAELGYKQAELNVRKTADSYKTAFENVGNANTAGVEGSKKVVDAKKSEADAARRVADAQYDLTQQRKEYAATERDIAESVMLAQRAVADAMKNREKTLQENARRTADAQEAVADAMRNAADAAAAASPAMSAFGKMMDNLNPAQRRMVNYLLSIQDEWKALKNTVSENILDPARLALKSFMEDGLFDTFSKGMEGASVSVGSFFTDLERNMKTSTFKSEFKTIMENNVGVVDRMGDTFNNLIRLFFSITAAAAPMTKRFADWVAVVTGNWADKAEGSGKRMQGFFKRAGDVAAQLGRIIKNIAIGVFELGQTAQPSGQKLLDSFEKATKKFSELTDGKGGKEKFKKFFDDVAVNVEKISKLAGDIGAAFLSIGDNQGIGDVAETLDKKVLPVLQKLIDILNGKANPAIADFLGSLSDLFDQLQDSPALDIFLGTLTTLTDTLTWIAKNCPGAVLALGTFLGVMKSIQFVKKALFIDQLIGAFGKLDKFVAKRTGQSIKDAFKSAGDGAEDAVNRAKKATDGLDTPDGGGKGKKGNNNGPDGVSKSTSKASDGFKDNLGSLAHQFKVTGDAKDRFILNLQRLQTQFSRMAGSTPVVAGQKGRKAAGAATEVLDDAAAASAVGGAAKIEGAAEKAAKSGGKLARLFGGLGKAAGALSFALFGIEGAALAAMAPFLIIVGVVAAVVLIFKLAWDHSEKLRNAFDKQLKPAFDRLGKALKPITDAIKKFINEGLKKIGDFLAEKVIPGLVKFIDWIAKNIPKVIEFAKKVVDWIKQHWPALKYLLLGPIIAFVIDVVKHWDAIKKGISDVKEWILKKWDEVTSFLGGLPKRFQAAVRGLWDSITSSLDAAKKAINDKIETVVNWVKALPGRVKSAAIGLWNGITNALGDMGTVISNKFNDVISWVRNLPSRVAAGARNIWNGITSTLSTLGTAISSKFNDVIDWVRGLPGRVASGARNIWSSLTGGLANLGSAVASRFEALVTAVKNMPSKIATAATGMWDGIKNAFRGAINWIIDKWNALTFKIHIPSSIGPIPMGPLGNKDFGFGTPDIPRLAMGGVLPARPGGTLALIGEAGRSERVQPLSAEGLSRGEQMMIELLKTQRGGQPVQIIINPPADMDVQTLARLVSTELSFQMGG